MVAQGLLGAVLVEPLFNHSKASQRVVSLLRNAGLESASTLWASSSQVRPSCLSNGFASEVDAVAPAVPSP